MRRKDTNAREVGGVDADGDGKADFAAVLGCNGVAEGECQNDGVTGFERINGKWC